MQSPPQTMPMAKASALRFVIVMALLLGLLTIIAFAFDFPPLTGRVVDQANVMTAESRGDHRGETQGP